MPKLVFIDRNFSGQVYELILEKTSVGRSDQNVLVIRDESVSSKHCDILMHGPEVIVRDLDSRNGTFVNGVRLNKQSGMKSGQTVRFGSVEARLEIEPGQYESDPSTITAVHAHAQVMREQRREQKKPKPPDPSKTLESAAQPNLDEQTILLPNAALMTPASSQPSGARPEVSNGKRFKWTLAMVLAVVGLGLIALAWLLWGRK
jgi:predicted component of type VI protein secretion system